MEAKSDVAKTVGISSKSQLHKAVVENDAESVNKFCKSIKSEDIQTIDSFDELGNTALIYAIQAQNEDIIEILLQSGANPSQQNRDGQTPLIISIYTGNEDIISRLIEEGANVNQTNSNGDSPLKIATNIEDQNCITILTEHGASFAKSGAQKLKSNDISYTTSSYVEAIKDLIVNNAKSNIKTISKNLLSITESYLGQTIPEKQISSALQKTQQLQNANSRSSEKVLLSLTRKLIANINSETKLGLLQLDDTKSIHLMSKAETIAEEEIAKLKTETSHPSAQQIQEPSHSTEKESQESINTEQEQYKTIHEAKGAFDIIKSKVLCRTSGHDVVLTETTTIKPHHPRTTEDATRILSLAKKRLAEESKISKESPNNSASSIEDLIKLVKKQKRPLTNDEGALIDKTLRPGKSNRIHIIQFPTEQLNDAIKNLSIQAFETGATIHYFDYHDNIENKNDVILTGMANINKLLDEGVHPDRIILQGIGNESDVLKSTAEQFAKRGINLTQLYIDSESIKEVCNRKFSLTSALKVKKDCPPSIKEHLNAILKLIKNNKRNVSAQNLYMFSATKGQLSLSQLANLYIKAIHALLQKESKYRNPSLPKERVECIIGITDIDESNTCG